MINDYPSAENRYGGRHADLILSSFFNLTGNHLVDPILSDTDRYRALFEADFCVVSHTTDADPIFNYGNKAALALFEMNWNDFTTLPSRLSAEPQLQEDRQRLLADVAQKGYIDDYEGVRVSSSGKRFRIEHAIVLNLTSVLGEYRGQAAILYDWSELLA